MQIAELNKIIHSYSADFDKLKDEKGYTIESSLTIHSAEGNMLFQDNTFHAVFGPDIDKLFICKAITYWTDKNNRYKFRAACSYHRAFFNSLGIHYEAPYLGIRYCLTFSPDYGIQLH